MAGKPKRAEQKTVTLARSTAILTFAGLAVGLLLTAINVGTGAFALGEKYLAGASTLPNIDIDYYTVTSGGSFYEDIVTKNPERIQKDDLFRWPILKTPAFAWFDSSDKPGNPSSSFTELCGKAQGRLLGADDHIFFKAVFALLRNVGGTRTENARIDFRTEFRNEAVVVLLPNALDGSQDWTKKETIEIPNLAPDDALLVPLAYGCLGPDTEDPDASVALGPNHAPVQFTYDYQRFWRTEETVPLRPPRLSPTIVSSGVEERG